MSGDCFLVYPVVLIEHAAKINKVFAHLNRGLCHLRQLAVLKAFVLIHRINQDFVNEGVSAEPLSFRQDTNPVKVNPLGLLDFSEQPVYFNWSKFSFVQLKSSGHIREGQHKTHHFLVLNN